MEVLLFKKNKLLIIRGIYVKDLVNLSVETVSDLKNILLQSDIPKKFIGVDKWPKKTNIACWYCDLKIEQSPAFIPENPAVNDAGDIICDALGHFHTWNCASKWIITELPQTYQADYLKNLLKFEMLFTKTPKIKIHPAPSKNKMKKYVGDSGWTEEQYNQEIKNINDFYTL